MPDYGETRLIFKCPRCGQTAKPSRVRTPRTVYTWSKTATDVFQEIAGSDISFRSREKRCDRCGEIFSTVEMAALYLKAMVSELMRLREEVSHLEMTEWARQQQTEIIRARRRRQRAARRFRPLI
jgi:uncharacterized C2H2 Zn-finger protein